jgi:alanyl-tRNA synthetase
VTGSGITERIYYTDPYLSEFTARVVDRADDGRRVYLDRTAFYPTSGGQPNDTGIIASANVTDVIDEGDRVAHIVDAPVASDDTVRGMIFWPRRHDHMQQHTGQHLLSAVFEDLFRAKTVSVHFGDKYSTVDLETDAMSAESLEKAERRANEIVAENRPVTMSFEEAKEAKGLRKAVDREGTLRIISIADLDRSACGGTHVRSTGEIGTILLRGVERVRKSMRVEFVCGDRAVQRARRDYLTLSAIASTLSTAVDSVAGLVTAQTSQAKANEQARRRMEKELARYRAAERYAKTAPDAVGVRLIVIEKSSESADELKAFGQALLEHEKVVFVGIADGDALVVAATADSGQDAGKLLREALAAVGGKGGGSPRLAQGSAAAGKAAAAVEFIRAALVPGR